MIKEEERVLISLIGGSLNIFSGLTTVQFLQVRSKRRNRDTCSYSPGRCSGPLIQNSELNNILV